MRIPRGMKKVRTDLMSCGKSVDRKRAICPKGDLIQEETCSGLLMHKNQGKTNE